jgi:hypothetical protein
VFNADNAVGASVRTTPIVERALVPFWHDGLFEADGTDGVVLVHDAVVEDTEANGDAGLAEQGSFDRRVAISSLRCVLNVVEGLGYPLGAGPVSNRFPGFVGLVEVLEPPESGRVDRGL